jgi:hypothetical protein
MIMNLELKNPRSHIKSASITEIIASRNKKMWSLSWMTTDCRTSSEICKSILSAKRLFSTHLIEPKYFGKNQWVICSDVE